jgi:hypothetical protein
MAIEAKEARIEPIFQPKVHANLLAWDNDFVLISSQNWLSTDPSEKYLRREIGVFLRAPGAARRVIEKFQFECNAKSDYPNLRCLYRRQRRATRFTDPGFGNQCERLTCTAIQKRKVMRTPFFRSASSIPGTMIVMAPRPTNCGLEGGPPKTIPRKALRSAADGSVKHLHTVRASSCLGPPQIF